MRFVPRLMNEPKMRERRESAAKIARNLWFRVDWSETGGDCDKISSGQYWALRKESNIDCVFNYAEPRKIRDRLKYLFREFGRVILIAYLIMVNMRMR